MKKQVDYVIIEGMFPFDLRQNVKEKLEEGYVCVGGCTQIKDDGEKLFLQAMVKYED